MLDIDAPHYSVYTIEGCKVVFGAIPVDDFVAVSKLVGKNAICDMLTADFMGASLVAGSPENIKRLRARTDLPPSEKRVRQAFEARAARLPDCVETRLLRGERGSSANAMCQAIFGQPIGANWEASTASHNPPRDSDDFHRCAQFVVQTNCRDKLDAVAGLSPEWSRLVKHWAELEQLWAAKNTTVLAKRLHMIIECATDDV